MAINGLHASIDVVPLQCVELDVVLPYQSAYGQSYLIHHYGVLRVCSLPDVWQYHGEGQVQRAYPSDAPETHAHKEHSSTHEKGIMGEWTVFHHITHGVDGTASQVGG